MKTLIWFLLFWLLFFTVALGQERPLVVNNNRFFPPMRSQQVLPNCSHFALIYYLKSSIWNKKFNRDPNFPENQFNHNFVWNQNIDPIYFGSGVSNAFHFMKNQGCASVADFPVNEQDYSLQPSLEIRQKALAYKSKDLRRELIIGKLNPDSVSKTLDILKDSLINGSNFVIYIYIFPHSEDVNEQNRIYHCYEDINKDNMLTTHYVTVVGYNDTIKTAQGRGAFIAKNSNGKTKDGIFYLDYNWFYFLENNFPCYFLEEDFSSQPEVALNLKLSGFISGIDLYKGKHIFSDTIITTSIDDRYFDFMDGYTYLNNRNHAQIIGVNGRRLPLRNNEILFPLNSADGDYDIVADLTRLTSATDFKSLSIIVFDPISSFYYDENDRLLYSYQREPTASVDQAFISFLGTDKKIRGKVQTSLPDALFQFDDFYSLRLGLNLEPLTGRYIFVKRNISRVKVTLINFFVEDVETNGPPVMVNSAAPGLKGFVDHEMSFQFKASDPENNQLAYYLKESPDFQYLPTSNEWGYPGKWSLDKETGLFKFNALVVGEFAFTLVVSDGLNSIEEKFVVSVKPNPVRFIEPPLSIGVSIDGGMYVYFKATSDSAKTIIYSIVSGPPATLDSLTGIFYYSGHAIGDFMFVIKASDGKYSAFYYLPLTVYPKNNPPILHNAPQDTLLAQINVPLEFLFLASDPDGESLRFFMLETIPEVNLDSSGKMIFLANKLGYYTFMIFVADERGFVAQAWVTVLVELGSSATVLRGVDCELNSFPNPFRDKLNVSFVLPYQAEVTLMLYDVSGRLINSLYVGEHIQGKQEISIDASFLKSGVYIVHFKAGQSVQSLKILKY